MSLSHELTLCGLPAVQARFARDPGSIKRLFFDEPTSRKLGAMCKALAAGKKVYRCVLPAELEKIAEEAAETPRAASPRAPDIRSAPAPAASIAPPAPDVAAMAARDAVKDIATLDELRAALSRFEGCALRATASETARIELAPSWDLFGVPSSSIMSRSTATWSSASIVNSSGAMRSCTLRTACCAPLPK